jgi:hypothetical protein
MIDWYVEGIEFGSCNCSYGCPCQFEAPPTHGNCRGFEVLRIDKGHYGDVPLAGLKVAIAYAWPGQISEGNGELQVIVDDQADPRQRAALLKVSMGEDTEPGATHWWVYREMSSRIHEPVVRPIEYEVDLDARTAKLSIPGVLESVARPIRGATGDEYRVRIQIPHGIEFEIAEIGSATTTSTGVISLELTDTYGQFNVLRHSGRGVVHV